MTVVTGYLPRMQVRGRNPKFISEAIVFDRVTGLEADTGGAALIEYAVLIGILLTGVILVIALVGGWIENQWTGLSAVLP
jgi:Flp pilus assembly pilin Flp